MQSQDNTQLFYAEEDQYVPKTEVLDHAVGYVVRVAAFRGNCLRAALAQQTTTERMKGSATVSTSQVKGEVVQVEGNDLLVKLSTGEMKTFMCRRRGSSSSTAES